MLLFRVIDLVDFNGYVFYTRFTNACIVYFLKCFAYGITSTDKYIIAALFLRHAWGRINYYGFIYLSERELHVGPFLGKS